MQPITWRRSSHSSDLDSACCVEIAAIGGTRVIRDSKDPDGPRLTLTPRTLRSLFDAIRAR